MKENRLTRMLISVIPLLSMTTIAAIANRDTNRGLNKPKRVQRYAITQPTTANMDDHVSNGPTQSWAIPSASAASSI